MFHAKFVCNNFSHFQNIYLGLSPPHIFPHIMINDATQNLAFCLQISNIFLFVYEWLANSCTDSITVSFQYIFHSEGGNIWASSTWFVHLKLSWPPDNCSSLHLLKYFPVLIILTWLHRDINRYRLFCPFIPIAPCFA